MVSTRRIFPYLEPGDKSRALSSISEVAPSTGAHTVEMDRMRKYKVRLNDEICPFVGPFQLNNVVFSCEVEDTFMNL